MKIMNGHWRWVALAALVAVSSGAQATWTFTGASGAVAADGTGISITSVTGAYAANGGTLSSYGSPISSNIGSCTAAQGGSSCTYGISGFASGATWNVNSNSNLAFYSGGGLGMSSDSSGNSSPNHAIDNGPATDASNNIKTQGNGGLGNTEALLISFSSSVILSSVTTGWVSGDSDFSLFRYTGGSAPSLSGVGTDTTSMGNAGWAWVGNYNGGSPAGADTVNPGNASSSWWLITAYNSAYGSGTGLDQGNDFFKLLALAGTKPTPPSGGGGGVPEPGSLALSAIALAGAYGIRRRRQQR